MNNITGALYLLGNKLEQHVVADIEGQWAVKKAEDDKKKKKSSEKTISRPLVLHPAPVSGLTCQKIKKTHWPQTRWWMRAGLPGRARTVECTSTARRSPEAPCSHDTWWDGQMSSEVVTEQLKWWPLVSVRQQLREEYSKPELNTRTVAWNVLLHTEETIALNHWVLFILVKAGFRIIPVYKYLYIVIYILPGAH